MNAKEIAVKTFFQVAPERAEYLFDTLQYPVSLRCEELDDEAYEEFVEGFMAHISIEVFLEYHRVDKEVTTLTHAYNLPYGEVRQMVLNLFDSINTLQDKTLNQGWLNGHMAATQTNTDRITKEIDRYGNGVRK